MGFASQVAAGIVGKAVLVILQQAMAFALIVPLLVIAMGYQVILVVIGKGVFTGLNKT